MRNEVAPSSALEPARRRQSTTVVLWFMLLVVFAPIALAHAIARMAG